ncbi:HD domain-containing protein [Candidatus Nanohalovita haloferacivicina]|uniref:HD domain-containing protein n=1 Tax=Candidatus Nanohalovita haloferacivicina TaxID=2978046 RepID=UPI00325FBD37|nr:HD superfamily phosphohydrolase [Candidatus Nanohalobia archaeon BNXNv]
MIRDSLHGYIEPNEEEWRILDSPEMQRLRRIRQMGLSPLVYPSGTHTRFQHSVGVMHVAGRFAESLNLNEQRTREVRMAGLMHDLGHGPFSHASEAVAEQKGLSHEEISCRKIDKLEDKFSVSANRIKKMIRGELEVGQVVAGDIDADRMDYLQRDAHTSGAEYGHIDSDTIIQRAMIDSRRLVFDYKAVQALESLLTARFHMIKSVYLHDTSRIAEKMLERALEDYVEKNSLEKMMALDDYSAHNELLNSTGTARNYYSRIKDRDLFKTALSWDVENRSREDLKKLEEKVDEKEIEKEIAEAAQVSKEKVVANKPWTPEIKDMDIKIKRKGNVRNLSNYSPIPKALSKAEWRLVDMNIYTDAAQKAKVREAAEQVLEEKL